MLLPYIQQNLQSDAVAETTFFHGSWFESKAKQREVRQRTEHLSRESLKGRRSLESQAEAKTEAKAELNTEAIKSATPINQRGEHDYKQTIKWIAEQIRLANQVDSARQLEAARLEVDRCEEEEFAALLLLLMA